MSSEDNARDITRAMHIIYGLQRYLLWSEKASDLSDIDYFAVDTDVIEMYCNPINAGGYVNLSPKSDRANAAAFSEGTDEQVAAAKRGATALSAALGETIIFDLLNANGKNLGLVLLDGHAEEASNRFAKIWMKASQNLDNLASTMNELTALINTLGTGQIADPEISELMLRLFNGLYGEEEGSWSALRYARLVRDDRLFHVERFPFKNERGHFSIPASSDHLARIDHFREVRGSVEADARALACMMALSDWLGGSRDEYGEPTIRKVALITGSARILNAHKKTPNPNFQVVHPLAFVERIFHNQDQSALDPAAKSFFRSFREVAQTALLEIDQNLLPRGEDRQDWELKLRDIFAKPESKNTLAHLFAIEAEWNSFAEALAVAIDVSGGTAHEQISAKHLLNTDGYKALLDVLRKEFEKARKDLADAEPILPANLRASSIERHRNPPPLRLGNFRVAKAYAKKAFDSESNSDATQIDDELKGEDDTGYTVSLIRGSNHAANGNWDLAEYSFSRALKIADSAIAEKLTGQARVTASGITGKEAAYGLATARKALATKGGDFIAAHRFARDAEKRNMHSKDQPKPDIRFTSERFSIVAAHLSLAEAGADKVRLPENFKHLVLDIALRCQDEILNRLPDEPDALVREYISQQCYCTLFQLSWMNRIASSKDGIESIKRFEPWCEFPITYDQLENNARDFKVFAEARPTQRKKNDCDVQQTSLPWFIQKISELEYLSDYASGKLIFNEIAEETKSSRGKGILPGKALRANYLLLIAKQLLAEKAK